MPVGGTTSLTFVITNPNAAVANTTVTLDDPLPAGMIVSTPNGLTSTCSGANISAIAGNNNVSAGVPTIAANSSCTISLNVTAFASAFFTNSVAVNSAQGHGIPATATITVTPLLPPSIAKSFGAASMSVGGVTSLTLAITNPNSTGSNTGAAFTDTLPANLQVATPNNLSSTCGGTATATAGSSSISLSGGTIAASSSCTVSLNVTATVVGTSINSVTVHSDQGTGNTASASINVQGNTATTLVSSLNPSVAGQAVTFTATVTGSPGTPTGTVTFKDGAATLATVSLAGGMATFTTSPLTAGTHTIVATYGGDANFATSTATLQQAVNVPADSLKLRQMQIIGTNLVAQSSGQAISGAIDSAINDGFNDNPAFATPSDSGLHFTFTGDPATQGGVAAQQDGVRDFTANPLQRQPRVDNGFSALGYAPAITKAPPPKSEPRVWTAWLDLRGVFWNRDTFGSDIKGDQFNVLGGVTARVAPDFLIGVLGGYETFNFNSLALDGNLKGGGWTAGTYIGWKFAPHLRLDAGFAGTLLDYQGSAGTASGSFNGHRWLASGGVTGSYDVAAFVLEPSARIYALWEHENDYTDSLGTMQAARNFSTGRTSGGLKVSLPIAWTSGALVTPYAGLYGDYYFSKDDEGVAAVTSIPLVQGWSARAVSGIGVTLNGKTQLSIGGELGGLGSTYTIWSVRSRAFVPF